MNYKRQYNPKNVLSMDIQRSFFLLSLSRHICFNNVQEFKNLSLEEISALIQPSSSSSKIITLDFEDIRIPGAKIVYDSIYMVQHSLYLSKFMLIPIEAQGEESYKYTLPCRSLYYAYRLIADQKIVLSAFKNPFTVIFQMYALFGYAYITQR